MSRLFAALAALIALAPALATPVGANGGITVRTDLGIVGSVTEYVVASGDSLSLIGACHAVEPRTLAAMNGLDPGAVLRVGQRLRIDNRHIVPARIDDGIIINVPQRMLFYFEERELLFASPVGLGRPGWPTPVGEFTIRELRRNPTWYVPESIQREMARRGEPVRRTVPPGPDNPLGDYWIGLSFGAHGIHGTNAPSSVYTFQTHGCIRMHPPEVEKLFERVKLGDPGRTIYEPVLLTQTPDARVFLEVHRDVYRRDAGGLRRAKELAELGGLTERVDWDRGAEVVREHRGIALDVTAVGPEAGDGSGGSNE
jgi:L,D-transpeptidase ErfK/SrfK